MSAASPDVKSIFGQALEIESTAERSAFLNEACAANPGLRAEVEDLLRAMAGAGDFMNRPPPTGSVTIAHSPLLEGPGTRIGPYKLLQQIGEGGMGVVYMAEQERPVRRKVALKIIKPGMDSAQVVARFEAERQALAVMDHTHIARVFDAGTTESGRPYFVMELVHGVPITRFCDLNRLTTRDRLELFVPVCQAIQHAHQKGIIHRDIKPSNVLVTMYDDKPVPKVIDFGVAKAIEQRLTERTLFTQFGALVGTFEYMSPEQAEMNALGVDTRSDIYSLGVLLYELLTGTTPLEKERLRQAALGEMVRLIKEEEPPRPSVRLSSSGDLAGIAAARKTEPARLSKLVRGEVDWIVMKCLEKDRARRYETATGLAKDVEHFLHDEPVEACPPSAGYRLRKFARKRKAAIAVAASFAFLLMAAAIIAIWQDLRAERARSEALLQQKRAQAAQKEAASQRDRATAGLRTAEASRESLRQSLYISDIQRAAEAWESGDILRIRELLDSQTPEPGETDLRGFEWRYLRRLGSTVHMVRLAQDTIFGQLSPDGTHYVYAGRTAAPAETEVGAEIELRLLDVASGRLERTIVPFPGETVSASKDQYRFSPDGKRFLCTGLIRDGSGREEWRVRVFEWASGRDVCTLANLGGVPGALVFDTTGGRLAVVTRRRDGGAESDLKIWDLKGGKPSLAIALPGRQIVEMMQTAQSVAFSPDGTRLAALTKSADSRAFLSKGEVRVWDAASGKELLRFEARPRSTGLAYSPDGGRLAEIGGAEASHWLRDAGSGKELRELASAPDAGMSWAIAFSPEGSRLAGVSADCKVRIWDVKDLGAAGARAPDRILEGETAVLSQVAWSADGRLVLAAGYGGTVMSWPAAAREPHLVVMGPEQTASVTASVAAAGSRFAAAFDGYDGTIEAKVWDEAGHVLFATTDIPPEDQNLVPLHFRKVELSRDGTRLAYSAPDLAPADANQREVGRLRVWDVTAGREMFGRDLEGVSFHYTAFSPDARRLATASSVKSGPKLERKHWVSSWDLETRRELLHLDVPHRTTLTFSPDGRRLAGGISPAWDGPGHEGELRVWDAETGEAVLTRKFARGLIESVAYNENGTLLAVAVGAVGDAGLIKVLDADTGRERLTLAGHRYSVQKLAFSPDGRRLASLASFPMQAAEVKLWDVAAGREMLTLQATGVGRIRSGTLGTSGFAFSADGHRLFYVPGGPHRDVAVQVWDATPLPDDRAVVP